MSVMIFAVAGVTFADGYPANLKRLDHAIKEVESHRQGTHLRDLDEGPAVVLIRNPENAYDANAIEVHVPAIATGDDPKAGMIGHVPQAIAARWAPLLDAGVQVRAWVDGVRVKRGHEDRPGIDVKTVWPPKGAPVDAARAAVLDADPETSSGFEAWQDEARARGSW